MSDGDERIQTARTLARTLWRPRALAGAGAAVAMAVVGLVRDDTTLLWIGAGGLMLVQAAIGVFYLVDRHRLGG